MLKTLVVMSWIVAAGCGGKKEQSGGESKQGGGKLVASCDQRNMVGAPIKVCIEYMGVAWSKKEIHARCSLEGMTFLDGACPKEGVVLSCLQEGGNPMEAVDRYYDDLEKAKKICATVGKPM